MTTPTPDIVVDVTVPDKPGCHSKCGDHSAQHQGRHRRQADRTEHAVRGERRGNIDDQDLRDRAEPPWANPAGTSCLLSIAASVHDSRPS